MTARVPGGRDDPALPEPLMESAGGVEPGRRMEPAAGAAPDLSMESAGSFELFDSHAHLQDNKAFPVDELPALLARARAAGVTRILLPASSLDDADQAAALADRFAGLFFAAGCHPHEAADFTPEHRDRLRAYAGISAPGEAAGSGTPARRRSLLAIGEIGLDYHYDFSPREVQKRVFEQQLEVACEAGLPLIIHEREATADCLAILKGFFRAGKLHPQPGVFHCYSGSVETARELIKLGFFLGFDGPITFKNAHKPLEVIRACPPERLLIETDSPYLTPVPHRGKRNEPQYVRFVAERLARELGLTYAETAALTTANACRCFHLDPDAAPRLPL